MFCTNIKPGDPSRHICRRQDTSPWTAEDLDTALQQGNELTLTIEALSICITPLQYSCHHSLINRQPIIPMNWEKMQRMIGWKLGMRGILSWSRGGNAECRRRRNVFDIVDGSVYYGREKARLLNKEGILWWCWCKIFPH